MSFLFYVPLTPVPPFSFNHQHWMMPDSMNAKLDADYYRQCVLDTEGIVYVISWLNMETGEGAYNFSTVTNALNYAKSLGRKVILRVFYKSYASSHAKPLPAYILNNHTTYGGLPGSGGLLPNSFGGYTPRLHNVALMNRFKALVTAMAAEVGSHPALQGVCIDEGTWSLTTWSGTWPVPGLTGQDLINCFETINTHFRACFPDKEVYVFINFFEDISAAKTRSILQSYVARGYLPAITDTKRRPENNNSIQDVDPLYPMNAKTLMGVDYMSTGANDSGLTERMIQNSMENARMGAGITAWYTRGGANSSYWSAVRSAIAATG